ncbi:MAG TPA: tetratricopeptide repeat protein [Candidatus Saccharimonadaceae bacterium]|nr:tetratricopeptide repeat protein [Candidatus Saccharimonadaceae bacterium]|tara:strand:+ start:2646 stop:3299 length:654 start_codon:yes stop_codon:yes gene_type:complete
MLGLIVIALLGTWAIYQRQTIAEVVSDLPTKLSDKLDQLWSIAQSSLQDRKYLRAEKALLTILRVDERNASAYNRLGILYAKQQQYKEAIECFEIAQSLEPSASSLHNVGLIYFETKNYDKAALAFEQALAMDSDLPARHIAYAKVQEKLGNDRKMIDSLERAIELDPIPQTLSILADAYERVGESDLSMNLRERAAKMIIPQGTPKKVRQPRRVIM